jgi:hypothetical protein
MNQQPDKLFREKLEDFSKPAPASAWDRIEAGLDKKNSKRGLWWKVAASLLLLAVAGYILWSSTRNNTISPSPSSIARKSESIPSTTSPAKEEAPDIIPQQAVDPVINQSQKTDAVTPLKKGAPSIEQKTDNKIKREEKYIPPASTSPTEATQELFAETEVPQEKIAEPSHAETTDVVIAQQERVVLIQSSITLVFSAEETNSYLNKNVSGEATDDEEKPSTFKKLLKKAQDLKNNQDPVGELRQKKNEILALNFKNEKRGQNK